MNHKNKSQGTDGKIVRQLAPANENLTGNVLKTILTANKVKGAVHMSRASPANRAGLVLSQLTVA